MRTGSCLTVLTTIVRKIISEIMKRNDFFKTLGIGVVGTAITPTILKADKPIEIDKDTSFAIDVHSISNITSGGSRISPAEVLRIWKETGILLYVSSNGRGMHYNPPMVFKGELRVVDVAKK